MIMIAQEQPQLLVSANGCHLSNQSTRTNDQRKASRCVTIVSKPLCVTLGVVLLLCHISGVSAFATSCTRDTSVTTIATTMISSRAGTTIKTVLEAATTDNTDMSPKAESNDNDDNDDEEDLVAKRIVVKGDVQGGYVRACVLNEAGRFRRLVGTMTDPDPSSDTAEIYIEGKGKLVDGFVRWCQRGKVGLSQTLTVLDIVDEEPTGLYESFYCKTK